MLGGGRGTEGPGCTIGGHSLGLEGRIEMYVWEWERMKLEVLGSGHPLATSQHSRRS